ncbi:hypothetical protein CPLU01_06213 [Colletotrichum plurivorum]|uniref:CENP-V/GFA domain-containing protein n=1 Tax=Colletotrichum plurivorum TaxID=2175906 RepID=A0A8H6KK19_9PEZI|nr:hypothetical protein CPLU01_06213 [Colletotrichum plurivorum]
MFTGSCLCGGIQLSVSSSPIAVFSCFCGHCSKAAGATHQVTSRLTDLADISLPLSFHQIAKFASETVEIVSGSNLISTFTLTDTSSGSPKTKAFCRTCGTPLWTTPASAKRQFLLVRTSLLDGGYV